MNHMYDTNFVADAHKAIVNRVHLVQEPFVCARRGKQRRLCMHDMLDALM